MTSLPCSIAKKSPLQKKEASLLTFSITKLIKVLVSLSKFAERQLVVIKTRNKPGKKEHITLSRHFVFGKGPGRPELDLNFCWSPGLQRWTANHWSIYFIGSIDMVHTTSDKQISRTFQAFFKDKLQFLGLRFFLTLFWTHYWLKHIMESFTTLTSSAMVDHIILYYFLHKTLQNDWWKKL